MTLHASQNWSRSHYKALYSYAFVLDDEGSLDQRFQNYVGVEDSRGSQIELRARFKTGPLAHQIAASWQHRRAKSRAFGLYDEASGGAPAIANNLYRPVRPPEPTVFFADDDFVRANNEQGPPSSTTTWAVADTLSALDDRLLVIAGVRRQGVGGTFADQAYTPAVGLVVKPWSVVSLYANYIETLEGGPTAPDDAGVVNRGQQFPPSRNKQSEVGVKVDFGGFGVTADAYQITRPSGRVDPATRVFSVDGQQRNRGVELNVFGELGKAFRLHGGVSVLDARLKKTQDGALDGKRPSGVGRFSAALSAEWDTPWLRGLTFTGAVSRQSAAYLDVDNTFSLPGYTLADIGARYASQIAQRTVTVRLDVKNAFDKNHFFADYSGGGIYLGQPRTVQLSATVDF